MYIDLWENTIRGMDKKERHIYASGHVSVSDSEGVRVRVRVRVWP